MRGYLSTLLIKTNDIPIAKPVIKPVIVSPSIKPPTVVVKPTLSETSQS